MLSQQQEQHQQELDKRQSAAQHQYIEVLRQYKMQMSVRGCRGESKGSRWPYCL